MMKRILSMILTAALSVSLTACGSTREPTTSQPNELAFTDSLGNLVVLEDAPERVAVLLGSYAEAWILAGGEDSLAAVTQDAFDERGLELKDEVVNLGQSHEPNLETLLAAQPDLVLLTPDLEGQRALEDSLESAGMDTAWFKVETFEDYLSMLEVFTTLTGREDLYQQNGLAVQARIEAVKEFAAGQEGPSILLLRAFSSNVKAKNSDNTAGVMLRDLGCENIADSDAGLLEELQMESILAADPEHIFVVTMGANTEKALENLNALFESDPAWQSLTAIREGKVHVLDKGLFHYKPNARWGESYEVLAEILYPQA